MDMLNTITVLNKLSRLKGASMLGPAIVLGLKLIEFTLTFRLQGLQVVAEEGCE